MCSYSEPPMGNRRTRIRFSSITTMLPCRMDSSMAGRLASKSSSWVVGLFGPRRRRITEGLVSSRKARRLAKSASAEIRVRSSLAARAKTSESLLACRSRAREPRRGRRLAGPPQSTAIVHCQRGISRTTGDSRVLDALDTALFTIVSEESQESPAAGSSRSRTASAAKRRASRMSSSSRSG